MGSRAPSVSDLPIAIVGGGISGLSAAWELAGLGRRAVVLEKAARPGGVIQTESSGGFLCELGPDSFLTQKPATAALCRELGLEAELAPSASTITPRTWVWHRGKLHRLPEGWQLLAPAKVLPALTTGLLSTRAKMQLAARWVRPPRGARVGSNGDVSVGEFLRMQFGELAGNEMAERIAGPLLRGVYGGEVESLSLQSVLPRFAAALKNGTHILKELRRTPAESSGGSMFTTLRHGMGTLVEALEKALNAKMPAGWLRTECVVETVKKSEAGFRLRIRSAGGVEEIEAAAVIVALAAPEAARMLREVDGDLAQTLAAIPYASGLTVSLAYEAEHGEKLPGGYGCLVPPHEHVGMLACTFTHQKFEARAPQGGVLLRAFYNDEAMLDWDDVEITRRASAEVHEVLGFSDPPPRFKIGRWRRAMAQYTVGHSARIEAVRTRLAMHPRLQLAGNAYRGIGISDCILSGREAARAAAAYEGPAMVRRR